MVRTLLIVDDHREFREFARGLLSSDAFVVTGEVSDGEAVLDAVAEQRPEVVLLDIQLPGIDGIEVARRLAELPDAPDVVLMSTREASEYEDFPESSVRGFIPKQDLSRDRLSAVLARCG